MTEIKINEKIYELREVPNNEFIIYGSSLDTFFGPSLYSEVHNSYRYKSLAIGGKFYLPILKT